MIRRKVASFVSRDVGKGVSERRCLNALLCYMMEESPREFTIEEVALILKVSTRTVYRYMTLIEKAELEGANWRV